MIVYTSSSKISNQQTDPQGFPSAHLAILLLPAFRIKFRSEKGVEKS
jgi:hypothetical protein